MQTLSNSIFDARLPPRMNRRKLLSIRDKNGASSRREKNQDGSQAGTSKTRPRSAELFFSLFKSETAKQGVKEEEPAEEEKDEEQIKVEKVAARLAEMNITGAAPEHIRTTLATKFASGDVARAAKFIDLQQKAAAGTIVRYDANVKMAGAENRGAVTCYLDALLFAMFAKFDAFERMLKADFENESRRKLATLLRLWVNLLRSGELIHTDTTEMIQNTLAECGWTDAGFLEQQDTSEAFNFITETLDLPLLSLQVDLFHQGKTDESDHKIIYERLLNLAVPPDPDGRGIKLEDCLEEYFNAQVDVLRDSLDDKATPVETPVSPKPTIRVVTEGDREANAPDQPDYVRPSLVHAAVSPRRMTLSHTTSEESEASSSSSPFPLRPRSATVIQRVLIDEDGRAKSDLDHPKMKRSSTKGSMVVKAVTIPAWQFFRLLPWHTSSEPNQNSHPHNNDELERNIRQRPVLGICLKRYMMTEGGVPKRQNTYIDIPDVLRLPNFMLAGDEQVVEEDPHGFSTGYKLVLQSVVCHRGDSTQSGHYIALARVDPKLLTDNKRCYFDPPPDYEEPQWVKFDDLDVESRVTHVEDLKQALKDEMPYLLFYQIVPVVDAPPSVDSSLDAEPPSYNESNHNNNRSTATISKTDTAESSGNDNAPTDPSVSATPASLAATQPSIRLSSELDLDRPLNNSSGDEAQYATSSYNASRRGSVVFTDPFVTPPNGASPLPTPSDETTAQRLSRAAARFSRGSSKSRTGSQQGDPSRISLTMRQLGLLRPSKEPLGDQSPNPPGSTISGGSSTVALGGEKSDEVAAEDTPTSSHVHQHQHKGKKGKVKTKGEESDRECSVM